MAQYTRLTPILSAWPTIFLFGTIGLLLGVLLSFIPRLEYSSTTRLLITQQLGAVDAYTASRSAERVAEDLANAAYTSSFYDQIFEENPEIDRSYFPQGEARFRSRWEDAISTSVSRGTGLLTIRAFHEDAEQAEEIATAVAELLSQQGWTYTSGGNITVQVVDDPLNSRFPVRPNILLNAFSGFILGLLAGAGYILIQTERIRRRHQLVHE